MAHSTYQDSYARIKSSNDTVERASKRQKQLIATLMNFTWAVDISILQREYCGYSILIAFFGISGLSILNATLKFAGVINDHASTIRNQMTATLMDSMQLVVMAKTQFEYQGKSKLKAIFGLFGLSEFRRSTQTRWSHEQKCFYK